MENIIIKGAKENNLKNITVNIAENSFTCITGASGCGKSSLVYNTIYAESQRNFLESMSSNMFGQKLMNKPNVDEIINLHPALDVSQNYYNNNPRSTVGTLTDVSHYLRALFALIKTFETGDIYLEKFFSFNNPSSCCERCNGLGQEYKISYSLVVPNEQKTLNDGAIIYYKGKEGSVEKRTLEAICDKYNININTPFRELTAKEKDILLYRNDDESFLLKFKTAKGRYKQNTKICNGAITELENKLLDIDTPSTFANISKYLKKVECTQCQGTKLKQKVRDVKICSCDISEVESMKFPQLNEWLFNVKQHYSDKQISDQVSQLASQITKRINRMINLKLEYLSADRSIPTLSGGEIQRIRISTQLNCPLCGLIYILDEPCKGLHPRNIDCIVSASKELVKKGNTVIAIEHNDRYIYESDRIIELGPVGGPKGGYIINSDKKASDLEVSTVKNVNKNIKNWVTFSGVSFHNISNQDVKIPVGKITCISGISGSGKSSLMTVVGDSIEKGCPSHCKEIKGLSNIKKVIHVNQKPIGKTPRSIVASYLEIYDSIRNLYASEELATKLGFNASTFSMNVVGGRCETCQGTGLQKIEINYLPDSFIICPDCNGKRFKDDVLKIKYKSYSIGELLEKSIEDIVDIFCNNKEIYNKLKCMIDIGLGYIKLGQRSMNLSGGEAQRIKLAKALGQNSKGKNLYILDEPTSGLSKIDRDKLKSILLSIEKNGNTIVMIEHNKEFIQEVADYLIDFGIVAGDKGGIICAQGLPTDVFCDKNSSWYGV